MANEFQCLDECQTLISKTFTTAFWKIGPDARLKWDILQSSVEILLRLVGKNVALMNNPYCQLRQEDELIDK